MRTTEIFFPSGTRFGQPKLWVQTWRLSWGTVEPFFRCVFHSLRNTVVQGFSLLEDMLHAGCIIFVPTVLTVSIRERYWLTFEMGGSTEVRDRNNCWQAEDWVRNSLILHHHILARGLLKRNYLLLVVYCNHEYYLEVVPKL